MQERVRVRGGRWRSVPGFEVDDNQRTSKESSRVSTPPSEDRVDEEMILLCIFVHVWDRLCRIHFICVTIVLPNPGQQLKQ